MQMRSALLQYLDKFNPEQVRHHPQLWGLYPVEDINIKGNISLLPFMYLDPDSLVQMTGPQYENKWHGSVSINIISSQGNIHGEIHYVLGIKHGRSVIHHYNGFIYITEYDADTVVSQNIESATKIIDNRDDIILQDNEGQWCIKNGLLCYQTVVDNLTMQGNKLGLTIHQGDIILFKMKDADHL